MLSLLLSVRTRLIAKCLTMAMLMAPWPFRNRERSSRMAAPAFAAVRRAEEMK